MDETLGLPTEQAVTVALRTQQILAHETGVTRTTDPLGGSWFVESLTDAVEAEALKYIADIDEMAGGPWAPDRVGSLTNGDFYSGGVVAGIHKGYFRRQIAEASYRYSEECEAHDRIIVGVNEYVEDSAERPIDILQIGPEVETEQAERLAAFKKRRNAAGVARTLDTIREACRKNENVMPALVDGALADCTLGEMVQAMADIYGRYTGGPEW
jgi:methylmalonyl-CoA mutase N-terminal domain/subunit